MYGFSWAASVVTLPQTAAGAGSGEDVCAVLGGIWLLTLPIESVGPSKPKNDEQRGPESAGIGRPQPGIGDRPGNAAQGPAGTWRTEDGTGQKTITV
jgi:hypothetical protein